LDRSHSRRLDSRTSHQIIKPAPYTNFGPKERQFARALGEYLGPDLHVATLANGTLALIAALHANFGPGTHDRYLLMPSFIVIAVAQAALWTGHGGHLLANRVAADPRRHGIRRRRTGRCRR
jgi:dTDP-4-amino-4,6-dideoxygalactose transaminase